MPGKKKKQRKPEAKGGKGAKKTALVQAGSRTKSGKDKSGPQQSKTFTLKQEATTSTFRSSKRLWQGEGQKLRNFPVEFIKSVEDYDPGKWLREQLDRVATAESSMQEEDLSELSAEGIEETLDHRASPGRLPSDTPITSADELSSADSASESDLSPPNLMIEIREGDTRQTTATVDVEDELEEDETAPSDTLEADMDFTRAADSYDYGYNSSSSENGSQEILASPLTDQFSLPSSTLDRKASSADAVQSPLSVVLDALLSANLQDDCETGTSPSAIVPIIASSTEREQSDSELFVIDTIGELDLVQSAEECSEMFETEETLTFKPRTLAPPAISDLPQGIKSRTPWARTIDDPVMAASGDKDLGQGSAATHFEHAFEANASSQRGKRGGRKKAAKIRQRTRGQDELELMLDYMENARWSDEDDEDDAIGDSAEPVNNQLLSELEPSSGPEGAIDVDGAHVADLSSTSDSAEEDDTDIDDDLELMIDAEMEEMEFDLGYSRGRGSHARRHGADRELVDSVLYHEDFNVYDYGADAMGETDELGASGANKRGLNKFINDLDLSDEELEATLIAQWQRDRGSKKMKKRERQRLHQDGIIGKKAKRARASHEIAHEGSSELDSFHEHIRRFVTHDDYREIEQLPMPAMEKALRRAVHLLSQAYGLTSASQGSGKRRYITLYKTKHASMPTTEFVEETLFRARRSLGFNSKHRDKLLPDTIRNKMNRTGRPSKSGGNGSGGGRLRDGDLVGADAPEIGLDNRGRQMLEKLGWAHGSGLGAGSQGIFMPLFATIKNTKTGL